MSGIATGKVFELDLPQNKLLVLLAYADAAQNPDGRDIRLSAPKVAWKTGYSERQARRIIDSLIADKILVIRDDKNGHTPIIDIDFAAASKKLKLGTKPLTSDVTPDIAMSPLTFGEGTPDIAMSETPDTIMSSHNVLTEYNVKDHPLPPTSDSERLSPIDEKSERMVKSKTLEQQLFDAIGQHIMGATDGNYAGLGGDITNCRKRLQKEFKNPPVTPDEIRQFAEWYRRTMRDSRTGKPLNFPHWTKIPRFFSDFRKAKTTTSNDLHSVPSFMLIGGKRSNGGASA